LSRPWEVWDIEADNLRRVWGGPDHKTGRHWELLGVVSKLIKEKEVLDAGCGHGHLYAWLKNRNVDYLGFDNSKEMLKIAREYFPEAKDRFVFGDIFNASKNFDQRDCVVCVDVLIHLPNPAKALYELWKLTKKTLILTLRLGKKHIGVRQQLSWNRFPHTTQTFPKDKYLILRIDNPREVYEAFGTLPDLGCVERFYYDERTEIFRLTKGILDYKEVKRAYEKGYSLYSH